MKAFKTSTNRSSHMDVHKSEKVHEVNKNKIKLFIVENKIYIFSATFVDKNSKRGLCLESIKRNTIKSTKIHVLVRFVKRLIYHDHIWHGI